MTATIYDGDRARTRPAAEATIPVYYGDPDIGKTRTMYDTNGRAQQVKDTRASNRLAQGWSDSLPTVTVTGTAIAGGVTEAAIVTGGETLIFTLSTGIWSASVPPTIPQTSSSPEVWDDEVAPTDDDFARTSDTVLTLTTPAAASYSIAEDEVVNFTVFRDLVTVNGVPWIRGSNQTLVCSPASFTITNGA